MTNRRPLTGLILVALLALPVVLAYAAFQRRFVESLATTGLKG